MDSTSSPRVLKATALPTVPQTQPLIIRFCYNQKNIKKLACFSYFKLAAIRQKIVDISEVIKLKYLPSTDTYLPTVQFFVHSIAICSSEYFKHGSLQ